MNEKKSFSSHALHYFAPFLIKKERDNMGNVSKIAGPFGIIQKKEDTPEVSLLTTAFFSVYYIGFDPILGTMNNESFNLNNKKKSNSINTYSYPPAISTFTLAASSWVQIFATFIGLPTHIKNHSINDAKKFKAETGSFIKNIAKNFFGLNSGREGFFKYAMVVPSAIWNIIRTPFYLLLNALKLITEFAPLAIELLTQKVISFLIDKIAGDSPRNENHEQNKNNVKNVKVTKPHMLARIAMGIGVAFLLPLYYFAKLFHVAGRAFTSPDTSVKAAFKMGSDLADSIVSKKNSTQGRITGTIFSLFSLVLTVGLYIVIPPLGIKALLANANPIVTSIASAVNTAEKFLSHSSIIAKMTGLVSQSITSPTVQALGLSISNDLSALSLIIGTSFAAFTSLFKQADKWNRPKNTPIAEPARVQNSVEVKATEAHPAVAPVAIQARPAPTTVVVSPVVVPAAIPTAVVAPIATASSVVGPTAPSTVVKEVYENTVDLFAAARTAAGKAEGFIGITLEAPAGIHSSATSNKELSLTDVQWADLAKIPVY